MDDKRSNPRQQPDTVGWRRGFGKLNKSKHKKNQPESTSSFSRLKIPFRLSRSKTPSDPQKDETSGAQQQDTTAQPSDNAVSTELAKDVDLWTTAEEKLRKDSLKCDKLEKYDRILEEHFGAELKPVGTLERRKQFLEFLNSKASQLNAAKEDHSRLDRCSRKAKRFFRKAVECVVATKDIVNIATQPCLPAAAACAGVTFLLSVSKIIKVLLYGADGIDVPRGREPKTHSIRRPVCGLGFNSSTCRL